MAKRGFIFTTDAFVSLVLIAIVIGVIIYQINVPSAFFPQQAQAYDYANDIVSAASTITVGELVVNGNLPAGMFSANDMGNTLLEQIAKEAVNGNDAEAQVLASVFTSGAKPMLGAQFGAKIVVMDTADGEWKEVVVRSTPYTRVQSSASRVLLGYKSSRMGVGEGYPKYNYPPGAPDEEYCIGDDELHQVTLPCVASPASFYNAGTLLGPTVARVIVWV